MKQVTCQLLLVCALVCMPFTGAWGADAMKTKEKKETFRFSKIKENAVLKLSNDFGKITIVHWDKNEILLERKLTISASTMERAAKKVESRMVKQEQVGNVYSLVLEYLPVELPKDNYNMEDEWMLYVPNNKLSFEIRNRFGDVNFTDRLKCRQLEVNVEFGGVYILEMQVEDACNVKVSHGSLNIGKSNKATVKTDFSNVDIEHVGRLDFSDNFGNMHVKRMDTGNGKLSFSKFTVDSLKEKMVISSCQHGEIGVTIADGKSFGGLDINSAHTDVNLLLADKMNARYDLKAKFGDIKVKVGVHSTHRQESDVETGFVSSNSGYIGSDSMAKAQINIRTEHAGITMRGK
ncbi:MAG: DUF4097 domain-containing protein [Paraprevotella sp.]|nr:DUF4097 domain-containing protein [Paraprevotella sp.]